MRSDFEITSHDMRFTSKGSPTTDIDRAHLVRFGIGKLGHPARDHEIGILARDATALPPCRLMADTMSLLMLPSSTISTTSTVGLSARASPARSRS